MARKYLIWARSSVEPVSSANEQMRLGQIWTVLGVVTDVANDAIAPPQHRALMLIVSLKTDIVRLLNGAERGSYRQ
jgi:hypothetical protein